MKKAPTVLVKTIGRGSALNEAHRFSNVRMELDLDAFDQLPDEDRPLLQTQFFRDSSRSIMTENDSPDLSFRYSVNFYRGCEHGCIYCYARPTHEYLNLSAGLDFESKIFVKDLAPQLLREKFMSKNWQPDVVIMSGVTDCYQPAERHFKITRQCLEIFNEFKNPVSIITKNYLVTRDIDLLSELAQAQAVTVTLSVTSLIPQVSKIMEPRASAPAARLKAIEELSKAGIPVTANLAPIVPGLTDKEIPSLLKAVSDAGAVSASYVMLRLPYSVKDLFVDWLENHFPEKKEKILSAIRDIRGQKLYDSGFGTRMKGDGPYAENIKNLFDIFSKKYNLQGRVWPLSVDSFQRPGDQLQLFD